MPESLHEKFHGPHEDARVKGQEDQQLRSQAAMNMALAGLSESIISRTTSIPRIAGILLEYSKILTDSEQGYVSEIDPGSGDNIIHAAAEMNIAGDNPGEEEIGKNIFSRMPDGTYPALWGFSLNTKEPYIINNMDVQEKDAGLPGILAPVRRFISVPVLLDGALVGQIFLSDAPRDYTENDIASIRRLASLYALAIIRLRSEEQLLVSLKEKEMLLKELHHRVKNNLQVVSSLLALQARKIDDPKYARLFQESQNRIHAMAMVHEKLYHSKDMARIDFSRYIFDLTQHLFYSYNVNRQLIQLSIQVMNIYLGIDEAVPCAMIINELVSNSLKHAFPDGRKGEVFVSLSKNDEGRHVLKVCDNGVGIHHDTAPPGRGTLGIEIVQSLTHQLKGSIEIDEANGTMVVITF